MLNTSARVECVLDIKAESGETPVWSVAEQKLFWVDQNAFKLNAFDPATGQNEVWQMPAHVSSFALRGAGQPIVVALRTGLFDFDRASGSLTAIAAPPPYPIETHRYNDGRCDRQGRYIIGSVDLSSFKTRVDGQAAYYRLDDQGLTEVIPGITCSNGTAFSPDGETMYMADQGNIVAMEYDTAIGAPTGRRRIITHRDRSDGVFDGAEIDSEGGYWVAVLMQNKIVRYTPDGKLDMEIHVPVLWPTKIAFGGPDLSTLYLTSASHRHLPGEEPMGEHAGGLFAIETGFSGIAEPTYRY